MSWQTEMLTIKTCRVHTINVHVKYQNGKTCFHPQLSYLRFFFSFFNFFLLISIEFSEIAENLSMLRHFFFFFKLNTKSVINVIIWTGDYLIKAVFSESWFYLILLHFLNIISNKFLKMTNTNLYYQLFLSSFKGCIFVNIIINLIVF